MIRDDIISIDAAAQRLWALARRFRAPLLSTLGFGFAAHMYMLTNKLLNADETSSLFARGAATTSGRWALDWLGFLFPGFSMPWLSGLCSLIFIAVAVCITVSLFEIKSPVFQALFAAVAVSSPVITATLCYMFTAAPYCLALLLSVLSVRFISSGGKVKYLLGVVCLSLSLGFYQGYFALAASFFIVLMLKKLLVEKQEPSPVFKAGLGYLIGLLAALAVYGVITYITMSGLEADNRYAVTDIGFLAGLKYCYSSVVRVLFFGYFALVNSPASIVAHVLCLLCGILCLPELLKGRCIGVILFAALLFGLLPIAVNCLYFAASVEVIHTLVMAGYASVYVLVLILAEGSNRFKRCISWVLALSLLLIGALNVSYANKCYLKMHLEYENAYALYSTVAEDIRECDDLDPGCTFAVISVEEPRLVPVFSQLDTTQLVSINQDMVNIYTSGYFLRYYVGLNMAEADWETKEYIRWDQQFLEMPCYPAEGYVQRVGNCIVAKLA